MFLKIKNKNIKNVRKSMNYFWFKVGGSFQGYVIVSEIKRKEKINTVI